MVFCIVELCLLTIASTRVSSISEDELLAYACAPYDNVDERSVLLGHLDGGRVVADFICSDVCPDHTVRVIHYELDPGQTCGSVGGIEKPVTVPVGIGTTDQVFCFPKLLVDNWQRYQRRISSVPTGVGPHE